MNSELMNSELGTRNSELGTRNSFNDANFGRLAAVKSRRRFFGRFFCTAAWVAFLFASLGVPRAEAQLIITGTHTIEVDEGETETINGPVSGNASAILNLHGPGLVRLSSSNSPNFLGTVFIRGSEFRILNGAGMAGSSFHISNGGTLSFDRGNNIIGNNKSVTLNAGNINILTGSHLGNDSENVGTLSLIGGANTINIQNDSSSFYQAFGVLSEF